MKIIIDAVTYPMKNLLTMREPGYREPIHRMADRVPEDKTKNLLTTKGQVLALTLYLPQVVT
jgi:hypothetical protein